MTSPDLDQQIRAVLNGYDHDAAGQIDHLTDAIRDVLSLNYYSENSPFKSGWNAALDTIRDIIGKHLLCGIDHSIPAPGDPS